MINTTMKKTALFVVLVVLMGVLGACAYRSPAPTILPGSNGQSVSVTDTEIVQSLGTWNGLLITGIILGIFISLIQPKIGMIILGGSLLSLVLIMGLAAYETLFLFIGMGISISILVMLIIDWYRKGRAVKEVVDTAEIAKINPTTVYDDGGYADKIQSDSTKKLVKKIRKR